MKYSNYDPEPIETTSTEIANVMHEGDPLNQLAILEAKAEIAIRWKNAINTILITQTFPEDWTIQGAGDKAKACLSSAGAERVARLFNIRFYEAKWTKQEFTDSSGQAYRYIYECKAALGEREVFAQGSYSTRDKFLGYSNSEWRPVEDINENNIRNAAYHICIGNAIKALLGLRGIPASRFAEIMGNVGESPTKAAAVERGSGTQGGTSEDDSVKQRELAEICMKIAGGGCTVAPDGKGWTLVPMSDSDDRNDTDRAKEICTSISGFTNKEGKIVPGKLAKELKGGRLEVTLSTARKLREQLDNGGVGLA